VGGLGRAHTCGGGSTTHLKIKLQRFPMQGGRNFPRGREGLSE
jgi:hypothetical protein